MPRARKILFGVGLTLAGLLVAVVCVLEFTGFGKAFKDFWKHGIIQAAVEQDDQTRRYEASEANNLKAIYTALMLFHDSEGQFPSAKHWMDSIQNRLRTTDMSPQEAAKKLVRPGLPSGGGAYGYAMNDKASEKYNKDLNPKMPLIFDSRDLKKNAHGDPATLLPNPSGRGRNMAIAVDGTLLKL